MAESLLKEKVRRGNNTSRGVRQFSRLSDPHASHSHEAHSVLRSYNLSDCDFGKRVTTVMHSRNFISCMWLVVNLGDAESGNEYCEHVGTQLVQSLKYRFAGRSFHTWDADTVAFATLSKMSSDLQKAKLLALCGGSSKINPGKVICPLYNYFSPFNKERMQQGPCWSNGASSARLELEITFRDKAGCSAGHTSNTMDGCTLYYEEILVPLAIESAFANRDRNRPRIEYNQLQDIACADGVLTEIDISALVSGGNIRQLIVRTKTGTGKTKQPLACARPDRAVLKINGVEVFDESQPVLDMHQMLQGRRYDETEDIPWAYPFCQNPTDRSSSGYLPSSNDKCTLHLQFSGAQTVDIIAEYEKIFKVGQNNRINKTDS